MSLRPLFPLALAALAMVACTPGGPAAPGPSASASALPTPDPDPPAKPEDFRPLKAALTIDGQAVLMRQRGFLLVGNDLSLSGSLGIYKTNTRAPDADYAVNFTIASKGKPISAPDFTQEDARSVLTGLTWYKGEKSGVYAQNAGTPVTLKVGADGKLELGYTGLMVRNSGAAPDFPERITVTLEALGIPPKK